MKHPHLLGALCATFFGFFAPSSHAGLIDIGSGLIYDNVLDITWAQPDVKRTWDAANTWAAGLTLGGVTGWRLPYSSVVAGEGPTTSAVECNTATEIACRDNELEYMFYHNLGGTFASPILASGDPDLALFPSLESSTYWSGTEYNSTFAWSFNFGSGHLDSVNRKTFNFFTWAVHAGNVSAVPVPAAVWLFGSGLICLLGAAKRKH